MPTSSNKPSKAKRRRIRRRKNKNKTKQKQNPVQLQIPPIPTKPPLKQCKPKTEQIRADAKEFIPSADSECSHSLSYLPSLPSNNSYSSSPLIPISSYDLSDGHETATLSNINDDISPFMTVNMAINPTQITYTTLMQLRVRKGKDLSSSHITDIPMGTPVKIKEICGDRVNITSPITGWISMRSSTYPFTQLLSIANETYEWLDAFLIPPQIPIWVQNAFDDDYNYGSCSKLRANANEFVPFQFSPKKSSLRANAAEFIIFQ